MRHSPQLCTRGLHFSLWTVLFRLMPPCRYWHWSVHRLLRLMYSYSATLTCYPVIRFLFTYKNKHIGVKMCVPCEKERQGRGQSRQSWILHCQQWIVTYPFYDYNKSVKNAGMLYCRFVTFSTRSVVMMGRRTYLSSLNIHSSWRYIHPSQSNQRLDSRCK